MFEVVCTNNVGVAYLPDDSEVSMSQLLTVGALYTVIGNNDGTYELVDDNGLSGMFDAERFQLVD
jgi:hypothetical protein